MVDAGVGDDLDDVDCPNPGVLYVNHRLAIFRWRANGQAGPVLRTVHGRRHL